MTFICVLYPKVDVSAELDPSPVEIVNTEGKGKGKSGKKGKGGGTLLDTPVFDSKDVELNAAMLLSLAGCSRGARGCSSR